MNPVDTAKEIQRLLGVTPDGILGPRSKAAFDALAQKTRSQSTTRTPVKLPSGFGLVGLQWKPSEFQEYLKAVSRPKWVMAVCLHHTANPDLAKRPNGETPQHIVNRMAYYQKLRWGAGPHLFVDDHLVSGMTPLNITGVHAKSFNGIALGVEVLGNYDKGADSPTTGRGLQAWRNAALITRNLLDWLGLEANAQTVLFHRDDRRTSKTCPGTAISKNWVLDLIRNAGAQP
jgi:hypothetical protein